MNSLKYKGSYKYTGRTFVKSDDFSISNICGVPEDVFYDKTLDMYYVKNLIPKETVYEYSSSFDELYYDMRYFFTSSFFSNKANSKIIKLFSLNEAKIDGKVAIILNDLVSESNDDNSSSLNNLYDEYTYVIQNV